MSSPKTDNRETGTQLLPRFDANGLLAVFVTDITDNKPLMMAYANEEALNKTLETGEVHFYSRSRKEIWHKGATSGNVLTVEEIRVDCDQDALWISAKVQGHGAACHTGRKSCFYRRVVTEDGTSRLELIET